jgi:hypothetical protein
LQTRGYFFNNKYINIQKNRVNNITYLCKKFPVIPKAKNNIQKQQHHTNMNITTSTTNISTLYTSYPFNSMTLTAKISYDNEKYKSSSSSDSSNYI